MQRNMSSDRNVDGLDNLNDYTNNLQEVLAEAESSVHVRHIIQLVLGGSVAFELLDRFSGTWMVTKPAF